MIAGPPKGSYWRVSEERLWELHADGRIWWGEDGNNVPAPKIYLSEVKQGLVPETMWFFKDVGHSQEGKKEIIQVLPEAEDVFTTPKPVRLIQQILRIATDKDDIVLDSFSGSGTTGHAVLKQNTEDQGNRRFILIEMEEKIVQTITAQRIKRAIDGYDKVEGLGGGFRYCELGATLFDPNRQIREEVKYNDLAQHVYFVETGQPLPQNARKHFPLLGISNGTAVYLLYNGILKDKSVNGGNVLTYDVLEGLPEHEGQKVIYGNGSRISKARLNDLGIVFKQIPYEIREM